MLKVIDNQFNFLGAVDRYTSYMPARSFFGVGIFELHLPFTTEYSKILVEENIIFKETNKPYIILYKEINSSDNTMVIKGEELKSYLGRWITKPPVNRAYDRVNANAETIMKEYVRRNCKTPNLIVAKDLKRGDKFVFQTRYKQLDMELEKIGLVSGLGWTVKLDIDNKKFVFDVIEGLDRSINQAINSRAIFSDDFENVTEQTLTKSKVGYKNVAIVAGRGEGRDRIISVIGEGDGFDRYETFIDAADVENEEDLPDRGAQKLSEMQKVESFESRILSNSNLVYEKDYNIGDTVTIQNKEWDVTLNSVIKSITEIYEEGGFRLEANFGNNTPTISQVIKKQLDKPVVENVGGFNFGDLDGGSTKKRHNVTIDMGKANDFIAIILEGGNINGN